MNNNDFYHMQDAPQSNPQEEAATPQRTSYTTPEGGSGVHYHADTRRPAWEDGYPHVEEEDSFAGQRRARSVTKYASIFPFPRFRISNAACSSSRLLFFLCECDIMYVLYHTLAQKAIKNTIVSEKR